MWRVFKGVSSSCSSALGSFGIFVPLSVVPEWGVVIPALGVETPGDRGTAGAFLTFGGKETGKESVHLLMSYSHFSPSTG